MSGGSQAGSGRELTLEDRIRRIEAIVGKLEADEVTLEVALELFEEGIRHVREAERVLSATELRVEELVRGETTRPFEEKDDA